MMSPVAELTPYPFGRLVARMFRELERRQAIFDLPAKKFVTGPRGLDWSVDFHGRRAATPLGPAAGPHSQLAQNLVLSFLGGARVFELKTVQVNDRLKIPRPCIDARTIGYNVEWSQELTLEQSLEEYVKGSMLIEILAASGALPIAPGFARVIFDMSVGYDLAGIRSERVVAFLRGMKDAGAVVDRLRRELPDEQRRFRDLDFTTRLSDTLTLSTFHGCPPDEIERIVEWLLDELGLHCVVKLNPTLLGATEVRRLLGEVMGYDDRVPDAAFAEDTRWEQAVDFVGRLRERAQARGRGFGVKLTNTLIVENRAGYLPASEARAYLSGPPLHVLAMALVGRFRDTFGPELPLSFSAGIDRHNFADAVALGLVPVTVCTDLLKPQGYGRMHHYFAALGKRMVAEGARTIAELVGPPERLVARTRAYVERVVADPRYRRAANAKPPAKVGSRLVLFDCLTCDKCIPVCPNDALFTYTLPRIEIPVVRLVPAAGGGFDREDAPPLAFAEKHQIAAFTDLCNECGNCDVFCPEDGGPYAVKPRFFGSRAGFEAAASDGFFVAAGLALGRFGGRVVRLERDGDRARYAGEGFELTLDERDPAATAAGRADGPVDLTYFHILRWLADGVLRGEGVNYLNA